MVPALQRSAFAGWLIMAIVVCMVLGAIFLNIRWRKPGKMITMNS